MCARRERGGGRKEKERGEREERDREGGESEKEGWERQEGERMRVNWPNTHR